jgi:hypothetical protein
MDQNKKGVFWFFMSSSGRAQKEVNSLNTVE